MKKVHLVFYIFIVGFLLNLVWENVQAPLYEGYTNFWNHFMKCFWASLMDAAVILLLFFLLAIWHKDFYWIRKINWKNGLALIFAGAAIAIVFEYWAFQNQAWRYTEKMPVVTDLKIGISPLLQMMLLPLLTLIIGCRKIKS